MTAKRTTKPTKPSDADRKQERARARLLKRLRNQSAKVAARAVSFNIVDTPELAGLAITAIGQPDVKAVWYAGIKFPARVGLSRSICDPETGEPLLTVSGGWLI